MKKFIDAKLAYAEKLKHPRWQKKRLQILDAAGWQCEDCNASEKSLSVHHCYYLPDTEPWEYTRDLLMSLCDECHVRRQNLERQIHVNVAKLMRMKSYLELLDQPANAFFTSSGEW